MDISVKLTVERLQESITIDEMIAFQANAKDLSLLREFLARFVIDPATGDYFPLDIVDTETEYRVSAHPQALRLAGKITLAKLLQFGRGLSGGLDNILVPPSNAAS